MAEVNPNSKFQRAIVIVLEGKRVGKSRKVLIQEIREACNMSDAGGATYYQNAIQKLRDQGKLVKTVTIVTDVVKEQNRQMELELPLTMKDCLEA
jgi:hypothetical protein